MKIKINTMLTCILLGLVILTGCSKAKFEINNNPDAITDASVTPGVLLPGALQVTSKIVATDWSFLNAWMGYWARNGSYQSLTDIETYKFTSSTAFQILPWNDLYSNNTNYSIMVTKAQATGAGFYEAIGRIMKAHNFGILVDVYNNVPYSEAFKGTATATPKYDKGIDIYKDLFKELDAAITILKTPAAIEVAKNPDITSADLMYAGDAPKWIAFANTLRLRLLIHLHNGLAARSVVPGFDVPTITASILANPLIGSGQTASINPGFSATKPNPYYRAFVSTEAGALAGDIWRAGEYAVEYYKYNGDPRVDRFYVSPTGTTAGQKGNKFGRPSDATGLYTGDKLSTVRGPGLLPNGAASRAWIFTSVESLFLQAEARQRGIITTGPTAAALLTSAVRESFVYLGLTTAAADAYITGNVGYPDVDIVGPYQTPTPPGGGLYTILTQKWFALNSIAPYETWSDYRRTDYVLGTIVGFPLGAGPPISVDPGNTSTTIPRRLFYPQNEYNYNAANVGAEGTININTGKVFWDLN